MNPSRKRRRKPGRPRSKAAESIHRRIQGLVRSLLSKGGSEAISGLPEQVDLHLQIPVSLQDEDHALSSRFAEDLIEQIDALRTEGEIELHGHRSGHAHCYWCQQTDCEHSQPENGHTVLTGWSPTGIPVWKNITNFLLAESPDLLDHLHGDTLKPFAVLVEESDLLAEVLPQYMEGSKFSRPIAGLLVGGFPLQMPNFEIDHLSMTALVYETRTARGIPRYRWNFIATPPKPFHLATLLAQEDSSHLARWISALRALMVGLQEQIEGRAREGKRMSMKECRQQLFQILRESQSILGAYNRRQGRKTLHALERGEDPDRPTSAAISDVLASKRHDLFHDRRESTVIVRGPNSRIHVFTQNGIHVTSARYSPESILNRIQRKRWVPLEDSEFLRFQNEIKSRVGNSGDQRPAEGQ
jgi:hypothetical protein